MNIKCAIKAFFTSILFFTALGCVSSGGGYMEFSSSIKPIRDGSTESTTWGDTNKNPSGKVVQYMMVNLDKEFTKELFIEDAANKKENATPIELWSPSAAAGGSVLGFRVNQEMKITVASSDFVPKVYVLELISIPMFGKHEYYQAVVADPVSTTGANIVVASYREPKDKKRDGQKIYGLAIAVESANGKTGKYTVKVEYSN